LQRCWYRFRSSLPWHWSPRLAVPNTWQFKLRRFQVGQLLRRQRLPWLLLLLLLLLLLPPLLFLALTPLLLPLLLLLLLPLPLLFLLPQLLLALLLLALLLPPLPL
jgi:hypothetical protein